MALPRPYSFWGHSTRTHTKCIPFPTNPLFGSAWCAHWDGWGVDVTVDHDPLFRVRCCTTFNLFRFITPREPTKERRRLDWGGKVRCREECWASCPEPPLSSPWAGSPAIVGQGARETLVRARETLVLSQRPCLPLCRPRGGGWCGSPHAARTPPPRPRREETREKQSPHCPTIIIMTMSQKHICEYCGAHLASRNKLFK